MPGFQNSHEELRTLASVFRDRALPQRDGDSRSLEETDDEAIETRPSGAGEVTEAGGPSHPLRATIHGS